MPKIRETNIRQAREDANKHPIEFEERKKRLDHHRARAARMDWRPEMPPETPEKRDVLSALKYVESKMGSLLEQGKELKSKKDDFYAALPLIRSVRDRGTIDENLEINTYNAYSKKYLKSFKSFSRRARADLADIARNFPEINIQNFRGLGLLRHAHKILEDIWGPRLTRAHLDKPAWNKSKENIDACIGGYIKTIENAKNYVSNKINLIDTPMKDPSPTMTPIGDAPMKDPSPTMTPIGDAPMKDPSPTMIPTVEPTVPPSARRGRSMEPRPNTDPESRPTRRASSIVGVEERSSRTDIGSGSIGEGLASKYPTFDRVSSRSDPPQVSRDLQAELSVLEGLESKMGSLLKQGNILKEARGSFLQEMPFLPNVLRNSRLHHYLNCFESFSKQANTDLAHIAANFPEINILQESENLASLRNTHNTLQNDPRAYLTDAWESKSINESINTFIEKIEEDKGQVSNRIEATRKQLEGEGSGSRVEGLAKYKSDLPQVSHDQAELLVLERVESLLEQGKNLKNKKDEFLKGLELARNSRGKTLDVNRRINVYLRTYLEGFKSFSKQAKADLALIAPNFPGIDMQDFRELDSLRDAHKPWEVPPERGLTRDDLTTPAWSRSKQEVDRCIDVYINRIEELKRLR